MAYPNLIIPHPAGPIPDKYLRKLAFPARTLHFPQRRLNLRAGNRTGFVARSSEKVGDKAAGGKCPEATLLLVVEDVDADFCSRPQ